MKQYIYGKNTILEALKGDKSVYTVYVQNNAKDNSKFKGIIYIFIIVAVGGAATFLVLAKRKKR